MRQDYNLVRLTISVILFMVFLFLLWAIQADAACQFPTETCGRVIAIWNAPGRYSYVATTGGAGWVTDASRGYWGGGIGKFCCLQYYGASGIADLHCSPK